MSAPTIPANVAIARLRRAIFEGSVANLLTWQDLYGLLVYMGDGLLCADAPSLPQPKRKRSPWQDHHGAQQ